METLLLCRLSISHSRRSFSAWYPIQYHFRAGYISSELPYSFSSANAQPPITDRDFTAGFFHDDLRIGCVSILQSRSRTKPSSIVLLQLHRTYFMRALSGPEEAFNKRHRYAPSVVAVWLGAVRMIAAMETLYHREPQLSTRVVGFWSNAFSAVVSRFLTVSCSVSCSLIPIYIGFNRTACQPCTVYMPVCCSSHLSVIDSL